MCRTGRRLDGGRGRPAESGRGHDRSQVVGCATRLVGAHEPNVGPVDFSEFLAVVQSELFGRTEAPASIRPDRAVRIEGAASVGPPLAVRELESCIADGCPMSASTPHPPASQVGTAARSRSSRTKMAFCAVMRAGALVSFCMVVLEARDTSVIDEVTVHPARLRGCNAAAS